MLEIYIDMFSNSDAQNETVISNHNLHANTK